MLDLSSTPLHLDPGDDQLTVSRTEPGQRLSVAVIRLGLNRDLQRGCPVGWMIFGQFEWRGLAPDAPDFIPNPVDHGLTQVRLHGTDVAGLEDVETPQHMHGGFLDEVFSVQVSACGDRQPAVRPALQRREAPLKQGLHRFAIAALRPDHELDGGLVALPNYLRCASPVVNRLTARLTAIRAASTVRSPKRWAISARLHCTSIRATISSRSFGVKCDSA